MVRHCAVLLAAFSAAVLAAEPPPYSFDLTIRKVIDLVAPADGRSPTIVRLMDVSIPEEPKIIHVAQMAGPSTTPRISAYTLCREGAHFESPTPAVLTARCRD
jgi:hypothetical protein